MSDRVLKQVMESLGPYRLQLSQITLSTETLGAGGFGDVKRGEVGKSGESQKPGTPVAVKQLRATVAMNLEEKRKLLIEFAREVRVWAGLDDPHIVPLVGFYLDEILDKAWLISPYMANGNARQYLNKLKPDLRTRLLMLGETADGLVYLHRLKIRHGDIKSGNVLIDDQGHAKLCDFGLAKYMEGGESGLTTSKGLRGSIRFMAPELFTGEHPHGTIKSDNWAWCCLAIEILFDKIPYHDALVDMVVMLRIVQGVLPVKIEDLEITSHIKRLFAQCWVAQPNERIEMALCSKGVADALLELPPRGEDGPVTSSELFPQLVLSDSNTPQFGMTAGSTAATGQSSGKLIGDLTVDKIHQESVFTKEPSISAVDELANRCHAPASEDLHKRARAEWSKYRKSGDVADLNKAIDLFRQALALRPAGHSERHNGLFWLAVSVREKYLEGSDVADINEAIDLFRQALVLRPAGHPERHNSIYWLALSMREKYLMGGDVADLNEAIDLFRQALVLWPVEHSERHNSLYWLAVSVRSKYLRSSDEADLNESIVLHRQALVLRPSGHFERHNSLYWLAVSVRDRYLKGGDVVDLDEVIDLHRQALVLRPAGHSDRNSSFQGLAVSIIDKYRKTGDAASLDEAINLHQQALPLVLIGHYTRNSSLSNFAITMREKYHKDGEVADLEEAINLGRRALLLSPPGNPNRHSTLNDLAVSLGDMYRNEGDMADLEEAINLGRQGIVLRPTGRYRGHESLHDVAVLLLDKYRKDGDGTTLEESIYLHRQALLLRPGSHPERYFSLHDLAETLLEKYMKEGGVADLDEAIDLERQALSLLADNHPRRQRTQEALDRLLERRSSISKSTVEEVEFVEAT